MSYNDWHTSETLITMILPIIILLSCLICFILIGVFMTHGQKKIGIAILSLISFLMLFFLLVLLLLQKTIAGFSLLFPIKIAVLNLSCLVIKQPLVNLQAIQ